MSGILLLMLGVAAVVLVAGPSSLSVTGNFYGKRGKLRNRTHYFVIV